MEFGFTELESEVYVHLLQHAPATGYKIAKEIGRSNANTYKAIESLESKGAIIVNEGFNRICRAVPADELLGQMERRFSEQKDCAITNLSKLKAAPDDNRIYTLSTPDQVYERARRILQSCEQVALLELFPEPLAVLREDVEGTAARGVRVSVRIYEPAEIDGVNVIESPSEFETLKKTPVQMMTLFADGKQYLIAYLAPGGAAVHQAVWSASPFLATSYYTFVFSDFLFSSLLPSITSESSIEEVRAEYEKLKEYFDYPHGGDMGVRDLIESLRKE